MKVMAGKINIEEFFSEVGSYLRATDEFQNKVKFISSRKVKPEFLKILLESPVIVYVKKDTIPVNIELDNIMQFLNKIIYIEDIITLIYLYMQLPQEIKMEKEFDCIFIESKISIKKIKPLKNVLFLDYFIKRKNNKVLKSGRLDYSKLENMANKLLTKDGVDGLIKKGKNFYQSALGLSLSDNKTNYFYQNKYLDNLSTIKSIDVQEYLDDKIYVFSCPICLQKHNILIKDIKNKKKNIDRFIRENNKKGRFEFICKHEGSIYENTSVYFGINKEKYIVEKLTIEDKIMIFIYMFYTYRNEDGKIISNDVGDKKSELEVSKYLEYLER